MLSHTKAELEAIHKAELEALIQYCGGYTHLAKMLGMWPTTVHGWIERGRISKKGAILVGNSKRLSQQFSAEQLRPDL